MEGRAPLPSRPGLHGLVAGLTTRFFVDDGRSVRGLWVAGLSVATGPTGRLREPPATVRWVRRLAAARIRGRRTCVHLFDRSRLLLAIQRVSVSWVQSLAAISHVAFYPVTALRWFRRRYRARFRGVPAVSASQQAASVPLDTPPGTCGWLHRLLRLMPTSGT